MINSNHAQLEPGTRIGSALVFGLRPFWRGQDINTVCHAQPKTQERVSYQPDEEAVKQLDALTEAEPVRGRARDFSSRSGAGGAIGFLNQLGTATGHGLERMGASLDRPVQFFATPRDRLCELEHTGPTSPTQRVNEPTVLCVAASQGFFHEKALSSRSGWHGFRFARPRRRSQIKHRGPSLGGCSARCKRGLWPWVTRFGDRFGGRTRNTAELKSGGLRRVDKHAPAFDAEPHDGHWVCHLFFSCVMHLTIDSECHAI